MYSRIAPVKHAEAAPYSLGRRLSWLFAAQTLLGLGAVCACIYAVMAFNLASKADAELSRKSELVRHLVSETAQSGDLPVMRHKLDEFFMAHEDLQVPFQSWRCRGSLIASSASRVPAKVATKTTAWAWRSLPRSPACMAERRWPVPKRASLLLASLYLPHR